MSAPDPDAATFAVTATVVDATRPPSRARTPGRLAIGPGGVVYWPRAGGPPVHHVAPAVAITLAGLRAPWASGALLVQGSDQCVRVTFPVTAAARLRRALAAAGVAAQVNHAWRAQPGPRRPSRGASP